MSSTPVRAGEWSREGERPIGSWLSDEREGVPGGARAVEGLRSAEAGAERAIEQQAVPAEYADLVRRVFRRYVKRAESPAALPDAPDVPAVGQRP
jgi:hypothetical protein